MMPGNAMELAVTQERIPEGTRRLLKLTNVRDPRHPSVEAFFDMVGEHDVRPPVLLDGFVFAHLFYAMQLGQDIHVRGAVSVQLLRNVREFQEAWHIWAPERYNRVRITADEIVSRLPEPRPTEAFAAYSAGVDSTYTVLRHSGRNAGPDSYALRSSVLMVHGFDVPLDRAGQFDAMKQRSVPLMRDLGLTVRVMRTNLKELRLQRWEDAFMAQLVSCLNNYSHEFGYALVASAHPYDELEFPVGSTAATDYLLSGAAMQTVHDGACASRTRKVEAIARNPIAVASLKVCWEGANAHENCGVCEKCVRTRLNFRAVGVDEPSCFPGAPDVLPLIPNVRIRRQVLRTELASILKYTNANNVHAEWTSALQKRLDRYDAEQREDSYGRVKRALMMASRGDLRLLASKTANMLRTATRRRAPAQT
jgi:hypothetical protein